MKILKNSCKNSIVNINNSASDTSIESDALNKCDVNITAINANIIFK